MRRLSDGFAPSTQPRDRTIANFDTCGSVTSLVRTILELTENSPCAGADRAVDRTGRRPWSSRTNGESSTCPPIVRSRRRDGAVRVRSTTSCRFYRIVGGDQGIAAAIMRRAESVTRSHPRAGKREASNFCAASQPRRSHS